MAVNQEVWARDIVAKLFASNAFLKYSVDHTEYVNYNKVHIPQAGAPVNTVINRAYTDAPAIATGRIDTDIEYNLDEATTDTFRLRNREMVELSYSKRESMLNTNGAAMKDKVAKQMLYNWSKNLGGANTVYSSGAMGSVPVGGLTGNRKKICPADIEALQVLFDNQEVPETGRFLLLMPHQVTALMQHADIRNAFQANNLVDYREGKFPMYAGFMLLKRSSVLRTDATGTTVTNPDGGTFAPTDNLAALAWHETMVCSATGTAKLFEKLDDPNEYGDVWSLLLRFGGIAIREDKTGVALLVEKA
jgi:hypothetical protein